MKVTDSEGKASIGARQSGSRSDTLSRPEAESFFCSCLQTLSVPLGGPIRLLQPLNALPDKMQNKCQKLESAKHLSAKRGTVDLLIQSLEIQ